MLDNIYGTEMPNFMVKKVRVREILEDISISHSSLVPIFKDLGYERFINKLSATFAHF